jgi:rare lipoprotein A
MNRMRFSITLLSLVSALAMLSACGNSGGPQASTAGVPGFVNGRAVHPTIKLGRPYDVNGETYTPHFNPEYSEVGEASWYGPGFHGGQTANGEKFDAYAMTAAHRTLPLPSIVRVTNTRNGKSAIVRINDRGPFADDRIIDLSKAAAQKIDMIGSGVAQVKVEYLRAETESYIAQLQQGKSPQQIMIAQNESNTMRGDGWFDFISSAKAAEAPPRDPNAPMHMPVTSQQVPPPAATPQAAPAQAVARAETDHSYTRSPFDVLPQEERAPPPQLPVQDAKPVSVTPPSTADPPSVVGASSDLYIQLGAFSNPQNAELFRQKFASIAAATIQPVPPDNPSVYRVKLGPFRDYYTAESMLTKARENGAPDAQLVTR